MSLIKLPEKTPLNNFLPRSINLFLVGLLYKTNIARLIDWLTKYFSNNKHFHSYKVNTIRFLTKQILAPFSTNLHAGAFAFDMNNQKARILLTTP